MATRRLVIAKGWGGIGNRLFSLLSTLLYAQITDRELVVHWADQEHYAEGTVNSFPRFFRRPATADLADIDPGLSVAPPVWAGHLDKSVGTLIRMHETAEDADCQVRIYTKYTIDLHQIDYPEDVLVRWHYVHELHRLRPYFSRGLAHLAPLGTEEVLRWTLREHVTLQESIRTRVDDFQARHFGDVTVGVHVRHSDRKEPWEPQLACLDRVLRDHPRAVVFVACDNRMVETAIRERYGRVVATEKWLPEPGLAPHRARDATLGAPDRTEVGAQALVDMFLLGRCDYLIHGRSSFARMARLVSEAPPGRLFDTSPPRPRPGRAVRGLRRVRHAVGKALRWAGASRP